MQKTLIAVCGTPGSFSEQAAKLLAASNKLNAEMRYEVNAGRCFEALVTQSANYAVVPLQNLLGGPVKETILAMSQYTFSSTDILPLPIKQNLIALPGVDKDKIQAVVSHPQALSQCRNYLAKQFSNALIQEYADTALAAADLAAGKLPKTTAIIASREAAELHGLTILEPSIQDDDKNFTTFLLIRDAVLKVNEKTTQNE